MAPRDCRGAASVLKLFEPILTELSAEPVVLAPRRYGLVAACDGGLLEVSGLSIPVGAMCRVSHGTNRTLSAEVIGFRNGRTLMSLLGDSVMLRPGAKVRPEGRPGLLPVGEAFLGRAVDGEGLPIDGGGPIQNRHEWPAGGIRTSALDRSPVREAFDTGVRSLNALTTFGVGQRIGVMAGSGVGKSVLIDMIAHAASADIIVVGLIGERAREVSDFVSRHMTGPKRDKTVVVAVPADHAPNLRLRGAMLATSMAEHFRSAGKRVLLIMDSLTRVAHAAREIGLVLGEPGAARGYPPSALATITKLVERAGNSAASGGSITGLYTVLADGDSQDDPVVDTARSILDGHIVLSRELAQRGQYPAVDIAASLSRVMNDIVPREHQAFAREFRALSATYEANRDLVLMGAYRAGADTQLDRAIAMHDRLTAFLCQEAGDKVSIGESVAQLAAMLAPPAQ
ncbi:MAG: FliI/YscN family ATPase [Novosphingobium sp.]|nr:FliI/YscN family ATPase [Novosphingobium sp.]